MNRKTIAIIVLGLVLLASLLACGYFGVKTIRRTRLRRAAMTAYEKKEYPLAERLLRQYVQKDPNAEAEFVALANIYHEYGNAGMEAQMWQSASSLNPLSREYRESMLTSAVKGMNYELLYSILGRKAKLGEDFSDQELYLYVVSACRANHLKDGTDVYQKRVKENPEAFHRNDLGRLAEFLVTSDKISADERDTYLKKAMESEDPTVRFEALFYSIRQIRKQAGDGSFPAEEIEALLKKAVETNYFAGTQYLADFYFSRYRFDDVITVLEPYLKTIDDPSMYMLYAESFVFTDKLDELQALEKKLSRKPGAMQMLADYCEILIAYLENDEEKLASAVRKSGNIIISPLSRFIHLRVAMRNRSFNEIRAVAQDIFSTMPFHDIHDRALLVCLDYISGEMEKPENRKDPSRMAELAKILSGYLHGNQMLTEILLIDQYKKGLAKETDIMTALGEFPDDPLLLRICAEHLLFNGKAEQALPIVEQLLEATGSEKNPDHGIRFLQMLALDLLGRRDEASAIFLNLVEQFDFDLELLDKYFQFCTENEREEDLLAMADKLDAVKDGKLEHYGKFFRAAALLLSEDENEDEDKTDEALDLLASTPTGDPDLTFYAANRLSEHDRFDEAEAKYKAILKTYFMPPLIYVNLSELYHAKGDEQKAMEAAKEAFELEKKSMLPAFIYAKRLSEANRYEEAVDVLKFPRHAVTYREDVVELWADCMRHIIEKDMAEQRLNQAEEQCKHLLVIVPDDAFGTETLAKIREALKQKKDDTRTGDKGAVPAA